MSNLSTAVLSRGAGRALAAAVGNTPVLRIGHPFAPPGRGFWAKLEGFNPGGLKDRAALHMVARARERGVLRPGAMIVESTSGTLGQGLVLAGRIYGHPVTLVTDTGIEPDVLRLLRAQGAQLDMVATPHPRGGWQMARTERVRQVLAENPGAWCPDQYNNPDNVDAYAPLAHEMLAQLHRVDVLVTSVGTGGHSAGISRVLRVCFPHLTVIGVDAIGSTIFGQPGRHRLMRGLGSSIHPRNVAYEQFAEVHWIAPGEAVWACRQLARHHYASGGWSVGAVALVAGWAARTHPAGTRIAAVFPDGPHRYLSTIYNDDYCREHDLLEVRPAQEPEEYKAANQGEALRWTRCLTVTDPLAPTAGQGAR
ncbi:PLP-dependent cysteine synthase family protein [Streptomyces sp. NPDC051776]|uniref:PLP-dependent cysteine synthase family protein n=1 Tax=Streptomyces sp. NPDC051776 TaxID=3155414 RepID=UPI003421AC70